MGTRVVRRSMRAPWSIEIGLAGLLLLSILDACNGSGKPSPSLGTAVASSALSFPVPATAAFEPSLSGSAAGVKADLYLLPAAVTNEQVDNWYAATLPVGHSWNLLTECVAEERNSSQVLVEDGQKATLDRWWSDGQSKLGLVVIKRSGKVAIELTVSDDDGGC